MEIQELLDERLLEAHVEAGVVNVGHHPELPLHILNYSQKAQFGSIWDDVTCLTRGLITNEAGEIVARPFRKFFNLGHAGRPETDITAIPKSQPEVTEKLDGSLGILWRYDGHTGVATRGSFDSDQAKWATKWYGANLSDAEWPEDYTPLFEIIYGENRIVVEYPWEGLVLLSLVNIYTGREMPHAEAARWAAKNGCKAVPLYEMSVEEARACGRVNFEGFVLTWHDPYLKIKVKLDEYCRLHRIITGFSPIALWEHLRYGWPLDEVKAAVKDNDFLKWINLHEELMRDAVRRVNEETDKVWAKRPDCDPANRESRKQFALWATSGRNKAFASLLFAKLDGKDYQDDIWKSVRPNGAHPFKRDLG